MKKTLFTKLIVLNVILLSVLHTSLSAQDVVAPATPAPVIKQPLTSKDKETIKELFGSIDKSRYRFELGVGEVYGQRTLSPQAWNTLRSGKVPIPAIPNSIVGNYIPGTHFWYVITKSKGGDNLEVILGKANAARLNALVNKYTAANN